MDVELVRAEGWATEDRDTTVRLALEAELTGAYRLAWWILRDAAAAEDAVAEAMLRAWERRRSLRDGTAVEAWFTRILVNVCRDTQRRKMRSEPALLRDAVIAIDPGVDLVDRDEIDRALARLTHDERMLLALRFGRDLAVPEIARRLDVPEGTAKSRLHAALAHLRAAVEAGRRDTGPR